MGKVKKMMPMSLDGGFLSGAEIVRGGVDPALSFLLDYSDGRCMTCASKDYGIVMTRP